MKETIQILNDVLGHLTAMSFMRTETSEDLEKPINDLSEAISEFENLDIPNVSNSLPSVGDLENEAEHRYPWQPHLVDWNNGKHEGFVDGGEFVLNVIAGHEKIRQ